MKEVVDKFSQQCSVEMDYHDYCNDIRSKDPDTRFTFWSANERVLIDMMLDGSFDKKDVRIMIEERRHSAKEWLLKNVITYGEWFEKYKAK